MSPPLVGYLMRRHFLDERVPAIRYFAHQHPSLRGVEVGAHRQIHQARPRLAEVELRLLCDRDAPIGGLPEPMFEDPERVLGLAQRLVDERGGRDLFERSSFQIAWRLA